MPEANAPQINPLDSWSEEDKGWLEKHVPEMLQPVAVRHGRKLFQMVMMAGACTHALMVIGSQGRGNRAIAQASFVLQQTLDALLKGLLAGEQQTLEQFVVCKDDIERIAALADNGARKPGDAVSKGGIILNS